MLNSMPSRQWGTTICVLGALILVGSLAFDGFKTLIFRLSYANGKFETELVATQIDQLGLIVPVAQAKPAKRD